MPLLSPISYNFGDLPCHKVLGYWTGWHCGLVSEEFLRTLEMSVESDP